LELQFKSESFNVAVALLFLQDDAATASESGSDSQDLVATHPGVPVCDVLHVTADHKALSVQQRKQLRTALKEQLADLKIEQAAQQMHILGL
jgi:hypothetical protein